MCERCVDDEAARMPKFILLILIDFVIHCAFMANALVQRADGEVFDYMSACAVFVILTFRVEKRPSR